MSALSKVRSALTRQGVDGTFDVLEKLCLIAAAGAVFVSSCVLILAAVLP